MRKIRAYLLLGGIVLIACGPPPVTPRAPRQHTDPNHGGLGANDTFEIRVYGEEDLSGEYRVHPDGTITYPFLGPISVRDLSPTQVAELIRSGLRDGGYLVDPQVSVVVAEYISQQITVIGEVRSPGSFPLRPGLTVLQAISLAGGFTDIADEDNTTVTRVTDGERQRFRIPAGAAAAGQATDFELAPGDIINVPHGVI